MTGAPHRVVMLAAALLTVGALPARAETSKTFTIGATIAQGCAVRSNSGGVGAWGDINLGTATGLAAGSISGALLSSGVTGIQLDCTPGVTATLTADQGNQASGGVRRLVHPSQSGSTIPYLLYANNSSTPWAAQAVSVAFGAGVQSQSVPVRAVATLSGSIPAGAYTDTVHVTVSW